MCAFFHSNVTITRFSDEVWEIAGCWWHSCLDENCSNRNSPFQQHPMYYPLTHRDVNEKPRDRVLELEQRGYTVHLIWEHDIQKLSKTDEGFQRIWNDNEMWSAYTDPIEPRSALTGGRTEPIRALLELTKEQMADGETIEHLDITSMYPYVQAYMDYIVGFPTVMLGPEIPNSSAPGKFDVTECEKYFGLIKARVSISIPGSRFLCRNSRMQTPFRFYR